METEDLKELQSSPFDREILTYMYLVLHQELTTLKSVRELMIRRDQYPGYEETLIKKLSIVIDNLEITEVFMKSIGRGEEKT